MKNANYPLLKDRIKEAEEVAQKLENGELVRRWELYPVRHIVKDLLTSYEAKNQFIFLIDECRD